MNDVELGFLGAIGAGLGAVKKIGGLFRRRRKKKKKSSSAPTPASGAQGVQGAISAQSADNDFDQVKALIHEAIEKSAKPDDIRTVVREIVSTVPSPVRKEVLDALKTVKESSLQRADSIDKITAKVDEALKPRVAAMLTALHAQQVSGQATFEHKELVARQKFREGTTASLARVMKKLDALEAKQNALGAHLRSPGVAIVNQPKLPLWGSKDSMERVI